MRTRVPRRFSVVVAALIYLSFSLLCTQLPLTNYLGYEFSLVIAVLGSFTSGFLTIGALKKPLTETNLDTQISNPKLLRRVFTDALLLNCVLLLIPLVVMSANAFFVKNCSLVEGVGFFLLLPVVSVVFASALGLFCTAHYRRPRTAFILFVLITFVEVLAVGYFTPAIFSYNFFYGYFPGLTYDEALSITWSLALFRLLTLLLAAAFVWMAALILQHTRPETPTWEKGVTLFGEMMQGRRVFITGALATLIILVWWFRGELGFDSTSRFIQHRLGKQFTTPHFRLYYSEHSYSDEEIRWVAAAHEFRLKQISQELHLPFKGTIESYIYPSAEVKQRLIGAGTTNVAKPWSGQIHLTQQSLDATLKHELVHVLAGPFGLPIINASLSTGLVEGLAMAIEWDWGHRTLHQYAAAMRKFGVAPEIVSLMSFSGFAAHSSSVSYVLAGSFCRYVMDTYGIRPMLQVYRSNEYEQAFGKPLNALIDEWHAFLATIQVGDNDRDAVDVLFRRPSIFKKVCARVVAARNTDAALAFARRQYATAAQLYKESFEDAGGYEALSGYVASLLRAGDFGAVVSVFERVIQGSEKPAQYLPLYVHVGLARWGRGERAQAESLFARLVRADLGEHLTETAILCRAAMADSMNRAALFRYFTQSASDSDRVARLDSMTMDARVHWLPLYEKGRVAARMKRWEDARAILGSVHVPYAPLEALRLKTLGASLFRLKRFEEAKIQFWRSLNFNTSAVAQHEVNDWLERCEWMKEYVGDTGQ